MHIPVTTWIKYKDQMARISQKAVDELEKYLDKIGGWLGNEEEVVNFAFLLAEKYGEAAGALACEMYDAVALASGMSVPPAVPAASATFREVTDAVNGSARISERTISPTVGRLVKQTAADTTLKNAKRDGAEFAWVPMGDTCAFCITLASRGWQSAKGINDHAEHIHANCDCQYAIRFKPTDGVRGYDPDKYLQMYSSERGSPKDRINAMRRKFYEEDKDHINELKRAAYAARQAEESELDENV